MWMAYEVISPSCQRLKFQDRISQSNFISSNNCLNDDQSIRNKKTEHTLKVVVFSNDGGKGNGLSFHSGGMTMFHFQGQPKIEAR